MTRNDKEQKEGCARAEMELTPSINKHQSEDRGDESKMTAESGKRLEQNDGPEPDKPESSNSSESDKLVPSSTTKPDRPESDKPEPDNRPEPNDKLESDKCESDKPELHQIKPNKIASRVKQAPFPQAGETSSTLKTLGVGGRERLAKNGIRTKAPHSSTPAASNRGKREANFTPPSTEKPKKMAQK